MHINILLLCFLGFAFFVSAQEPYSIPRPTFEVFRPRGFRVSIPDSPGVRFFGFHGAINRKLQGLENGDLADDTKTKSNGRWEYENNRVKLNPGDVVNYWIFVTKGNLGYRIDDQAYIVTSSSIQEAPPGFIGDIKTTPRPYPTYRPTPSSSSCQCELPTPKPSASVPSGHIPVTCFLPQNVIGNAAATNYVPTTTVTPLPLIVEATTVLSGATEPPPELGIWRDLLANLSTENAEFRNQIEFLQQSNDFLVKKLKSIGDENMDKLILRGRLPPTEEPLELVKMVLKEKLRMQNTKNIKSAVKNEDGTITFEMATFEDKLHILQLSKKKLDNSRFIINDIETVSFMNKDRMIFDHRMQNKNS